MAPASLKQGLVDYVAGVEAIFRSPMAPVRPAQRHVSLAIMRTLTIFSSAVQ